MGTALDAQLRLLDVFVTPEFLSQGGPILERIERLGITVSEVKASLLDEIADTDSPRGLVAVAARPEWQLERIPVRSGAAWVFLDGAQDPGNLGAVARVVEAAGVAGLVLSPGSVHPSHPRALRASAGSLLRLPVAPDVAVSQLRRHLESVAPLWAAAVPHGGDAPWDRDLSGTTVLLLGAEGPGLSDSALAHCDVRITAPLASGVESLNLAVSAAVVLFERVRQQTRQP